MTIHLLILSTFQDVEYDELDEHNDNIIVDDNNDNNLQFDKNYHFQVISHKAVKHSDGKHK